MTAHPNEGFRLDVLIVGGGIAGLWLLDDLCRAGYQALLVESGALGSGQTVASQGVLHTGLKHALAGRLGTHVDALKEMPGIWHDCLAGNREPDLRAVERRADACYCWRTSSVVSALAQFGARIGLRTTMVRVSGDERPVPLRNDSGAVYRLDEQVIDPSSLLTVLAERHRHRLLAVEAIDIDLHGPGNVRRVRLAAPHGSQTLRLSPRHLVLTAGEGNAELRRACGLATEAMQRVPLSILVVGGNLPTLNGFCMNGTKAQAIITTQRFAPDYAVWQVGCERAADVPAEEFRSFAFRELRDALPGFVWPAVTLQTYRTNRAEAETADGSRSSDAQVLRDGNVITAWPTKLVLAPRLVEKVRELLPHPSVGADEAAVAVAAWPRPVVAPFPWLTR